ncbi:hypothetical protein [Luteimonas fraxinea]|uniref:hypothetical protein n=1 Tax=Luteimonas fraxinea TaxID=2901869 RepID=UPI001E60A4FB|nr:hypothetical protein [Luteimonas fraxinea]MCD9124597.1 hypothetical protein [Luteimonas fraxinea]
MGIPVAIPAKTDAGRAEIETRAQRLPTALRSLLLLVDGQRGAVELDAIARRLHAPADALAQLAALGLVTASDVAASHSAEDAGAISEPRSDADAQRHLILYALMTDATRAHLGLVGGYLTQLKLERADDAAALEALLPTLQAALTKARDAAVAAEIIAGIRAAADTGAGAA